MDLNNLTAEQQELLKTLLSQAAPAADPQPESAAPMTAEKAQQVIQSTLLILATNCPALSVPQRLEFETALKVEG